MAEIDGSFKVLLRCHFVPIYSNKLAVAVIYEESMYDLRKPDSTIVGMSSVSRPRLGKRTDACTTLSRSDSSTNNDRQKGLAR